MKQHRLQYRHNTALEVEIVVHTSSIFYPYAAKTMLGLESQSDGGWSKVESNLHKSVITP
jgi:hypothetical protein